MLSASPRSSAENVRFTAKRAEMDYCRVVGPRGLCRPLDERKGSQQTLRLSHPVRVARKQGKQATSCGQGGQGSAEERAGSGGFS